MPLVSLLIFFVPIVLFSAPPSKQDLVNELTKGVYDATGPFDHRWMIDKTPKNHVQATGRALQNHARDRVYIPFPPLKIASYMDELWDTFPQDTIPLEKTRENKEARILYNLYQAHKYKEFLEAYKAFIRLYKKSNYAEVVSHLAARVHYKIFQKNKDMGSLNRIREIYTQLEIKYPESKYKESNQLILAYTHLQLKDGARAIQYLIKVLDRNEWSEKYHPFMLNLLEAYLLLDRPKKALDIYKELEKASHPEIRMERDYKLGDIYFQMGDFKKSIHFYRLALEKYPHSSHSFPNAYYHMAESLFWLKQHKESLKSYIHFVRTFPSHPHGGYALTRMGELLDILGADTQRVKGVFLECQFRFKGHPGADVARVRELGQSMEKMKVKELNKSLVEMEKIAHSSPLLEIRSLVDFVLAEGFQSRGNYHRAVNYLTRSFRRNGEALREETLGKIVENIALKIWHSLKQGDMDGALEEYERHAPTWLQHIHFTDLEYFLGQMLEQSGLWDEAIFRYRKILSQIKVKGEEVFGLKDSIQLRIAASYIKKGDIKTAHSFLVRIVEPFSTDKTCSLLKKAYPFIQCQGEKEERAQLLAWIYEEKGEYDRSKTYLEQFIKIHESLPLRVILSRVHLKIGEWEQAKVNLDVIQRAMANGVRMDDSLKEEFLKIKATWFLERKNKVAAFRTYAHLLEKFETPSEPRNAIRYRAGKILLEKGDTRGAKKIWQGLKGENGKWYRRLIKESLRHQEWMKEHKMYIQKVTKKYKIVAGGGNHWEI